MNDFLNMAPEKKSENMICCVCREKHSGFIVDKGFEGLDFYCYNHWKQKEDRDNEKK